MILATSLKLRGRGTGDQGGGVVALLGHRRGVVALLGQGGRFVALCCHGGGVVAPSRDQGEVWYHYWDRREVS